MTENEVRQRIRDAHVMLENALAGTFEYPIGVSMALALVIGTLKPALDALIAEQTKQGETR